MKTLRTLVVDDERLAREEVCFLLDQAGGSEIVGQAANGIEALRLAGELKPDLILLDVQMPGLTGFEVAQRIVEAGLLSHIVFLTAYDQYAVDAFGVNAVDYVLKPIDLTRLEEMLTRVRRRDESARRALTPEDIGKVVEAVRARQDRRDQIAVRAGERFVLVQAGELIHASVVEDEVVVVTPAVSGASNYRTLDELQARLDPGIFWRVHRSHLVNITKIKEIVPWFSRNYLLKMNDAKSTEIPVSRSQTKRLREYLQL
jgi:two-component system response regulator LytT